MKNVIVDTNILFSILLWKNRKFREVLFEGTDVDFYCCRFAIVELFKYKEKILKLSALEEEAFLDVFYTVLKRIRFYDEHTVTNESIQKAYELCKNVDEKDTPFVALTLELEGELWTGDKALKEGLRARGFETFFEIF